MLKNQDVYIGTPDAVRDLMYVDDHVNAYLSLLKTKAVNDTFNFGTGSGMTMLELANLVRRKLKFKGRIIPKYPPGYLYRPLSESYLSLDSSKAKEILNWKPKVDLDKGLDQTIRYWKSRIN